MKRLLQLRKDRAQLLKEMRAILDKAGAEKRDLLKEEQDKHAELEKSWGTISEQIKVEERMVEMEAQVEHDFEGEENPEIEPASPETRAKPGAQAPAAKKLFANLGDQLMAVRNASVPGARIDPRLLEVRAASGLNEAGNPSDGGFLLQNEFSSELMKNAWDYGQVISRVGVTPLGPNSNGMTFLTLEEYSRVTGSRQGGVQLYWAAEAETKSASKPKFGQVNMNLHKLLGFCYATEELLADSTALESEISTAFRDEFAFVLDDVVISGNGAGKPLGLLNSASLVTISKEGSQAAATILFKNVLKMYARMYPRGYNNAVWFINQACIVQLAQMVLAGASSDVPVYLPAGGASERPYATLFGRPVIPIEQCSALGTVGDIIFADLSQYRMITKDGLKSSSSVHVRFLYDEQVFKFTYRCDGQPKWKKPVTPYKGTDTISPFITLETRA